jgi:hypothetical protein
MLPVAASQQGTVENHDVIDLCSDLDGDGNEQGNEQKLAAVKGKSPSFDTNHIEVYNHDFVVIVCWTLSSSSCWTVFLNTNLLRLLSFFGFRWIRQCLVRSL